MKPEIKFIAWIAAICLISTIIFVPVRYFNNLSETAYEEFKPSEMLRKYEWFKDAGSVLDAKLKDINVYQSRLDLMIESYDDTKRKDWDRTDKETFNIWSLEVSGIKASYNQLAAEYNSNISKFNWSSFEGDRPEEYQILINK